jgi:hypothetical protein
MKGQCMKRCTVGRLAVLVALAMTDIAGLGSRAVGQTEKPNVLARDHNSVRSSPPDTTPYVRPVIPQDLMKTPLPKRRGDRSLSHGLSHQDSGLPPGKR